MPIRSPYPSFSLVIYCAFLEPWEAEALMQSTQATPPGDDASVTTQALNNHMSEEIALNNEPPVPTPTKMIDDGALVIQDAIQGPPHPLLTSESSLGHHDNVVDSVNIPYVIKPCTGFRQKSKQIWVSLKILCRRSLLSKFKKRHHVNVQA